MRKLFLAPLLSALLAIPVFAGDLTKIRVVVTTSAGKPVERAGVRVAFQSGRSVVKLGKAIRTSWEMRTTQEGIAEMPELPKGKILIQVNAKNYQTYGETFDIDEDARTIEVKLNRPQEQYSAH
ncbi:MAG: hypothetical protein ABL995_01060 [Bryobacteraceae bacterium]